MTEPLPDASTAAQYDTKGPHLSRSRLAGRIGVSLVVACTVESTPNLTKATDDVVLVTKVTSPPPAMVALAEFEEAWIATVLPIG